MLNSVRETVLRYGMLAQGDKIVAGVSGGADSVALLHILLELRDEFSLEVYAAHINHCLRGEESDGDENFVRRLCVSLDVLLDVCRVDVKKEAAEKGLSLEEAGRQCRYAFFDSAVKKRGASKIAVAHNMDDNAETVILNLARGTGLKGLCGIPPVRSAAFVIIRPLAEQPRKTIERFLFQNKIPYRNDSTNSGDDYARNRVRNKILPAIASGLNKNAAAVISRSAALLRTDEDFITNAALAAYKECVSCKGSAAGSRLGLNAAKLLRFHPALRGRIIRMAYRDVSGTVKDLSLVHCGIVEDIAAGAAGRRAGLPREVSVRKENDELVFFKNNNDEPAFYIEPVFDKPVYVPQLNKTVTISLEYPSENASKACTKAFRYDRVDGVLALRSWLPGDRIYLKGAGTKKLQDYFTDKKIPRHLRGGVPLLANGGEIIWIMDKDGRSNEKYAPAEDAKNIYVRII